MNAINQNQVGPFKLTSAELNEQLIGLPAWKLTTIDVPHKANIKGNELIRTYTFPRFVDAIQFMSKAAQYIDQINHHPKWENEWVNLIVHLSTHDLEYNISNLDITLAHYLENLFKRDYAVV